MDRGINDVVIEEVSSFLLVVCLNFKRFVHLCEVVTIDIVRIVISEAQDSDVLPVRINCVWLCCFTVFMSNQENEKKISKLIYSY